MKLLTKQNNIKLIVSLILFLSLIFIRERIRLLKEIKGLPNPLPDISLSDEDSGEKKQTTEMIAQYTANILLGGMKAFVIDFLWIQLGEATKNESWETYEAILQMIRVLQPKNPHVLTFLGWNTAYNISAYKSNVEEQFKFIEAGADYLKSALEQIPDNPEIAAEIARIYYHLIPLRPKHLYFYEKKYNHPPLAKGEEWLLKMTSLCEKIGDYGTITKYDGTIMHIKSDLPYYMIRLAKNKSDVLQKCDEAVELIEMNLKKHKGKAPYNEKLFRQISRSLQEARPIIQKDLDAQQFLNNHNYNEYLNLAKSVLNSYREILNKHSNLDLEGLRVRIQEILQDMTLCYFKKFDSGEIVEAVQGMNEIAKFTENIIDKNLINQVVNYLTWELVERCYRELSDAMMNEYKILIGLNFDAADWRINLLEANAIYRRINESDYFYLLEIANERSKKLEKYMLQK